MITRLELPSLSPTMEEGTVVAWQVAPGDTVQAGQMVAEVQTDKAVLEWEAMEEGVVAAILLEQGAVAKVGMIAALLTSEAGEDLGSALDEARAENEKMMADAPAVAPAKEEPPPPPEKPDPAEVGGREPEVPFKNTPARSAPVATPAAAPTPTTPVAGQRMSPVAARIAAANGLSLDGLRGSGPDGRIVKADVLAALSAASARSTPAQAGNPFLRGGRPDHDDLPVSQMRRIIGERLQQSKQEAPHFQVVERARVDALLATRAQLNAIDGVKISINDLVIKALALTLIRHPAVNATFDGTTIRRYNTADISVAVAIPDGLITPILRGAERLTLSEISATVKTLAKRATANRLEPQEYQGGSFTLSNLGMFGIEQFNAIINPPQVAILAVGGVKDEPVVDDGQVIAGKVTRLTLSADHRAVDGADAAKFMADLRSMIENPATLML